MKCGVYIRVSTDIEEQRTSLENQQQFFYNVMAEKGWELYQFYSLIGPLIVRTPELPTIS